jgi:hypothetical protein
VGGEDVKKPARGGLRVGFASGYWEDADVALR